MKCLCIKNGYMKNKQQFCYEGHVYYYNITTSRFKVTHPYNVDTMPPGGIIGHSMGKAFFRKYFKPLNEFLEEELFEI